MATSTVTVMPLLMVTVSAAVGTAAPPQVAVLLQLPLTLATRCAIAVLTKNKLDISMMMPNIPDLPVIVFTGFFSRWFIAVGVNASGINAKDAAGCATSWCWFVREIFSVPAVP